MFGQYKKPIIVSIRVFQLICVAFAVSGGIWASSDLLIVHVLVGIPVTPLSALFILYGTVGTLFSEIMARLVNRKTEGSKKQ